MVKKIISILLVITITINFILISPCRAWEAESDADSREKNSTYEDKIGGDDGPGDVGKGIIGEGETETSEGSGEKKSTAASAYGTSIMGFILGIISRIINVFVLQIDLMLALLSLTNVTGDEQDNLDDNIWLTMDKIVFNRVGLLDINYINVPESEEGSTYEVGDAVIEMKPANVAVKRQVASIYYVCRIIALILSLCVLIYIGIRMVISTVAAEQAKYKKMLISWVESICILAFMLYIMAALIYLGNTLVGLFYNMRNDLMGQEVFSGSAGTYGVFEDTIRSNVLNLVFEASGIQLAFWSVVYWAMLFMVFKFFWMYLKRFLIVGFLIIISPFITITYSIDKAGDNRAQAFGEWMKEFTINVLIQPLHALLYLIFVFSANAIATEAPLVGIVFMYAMVQGEKIVKRILKVGGMTMKGMEGIRMPGKKGG